MEQVRVNFLTDKDTKMDVEEILNDLGLNMSTAINMYLKQIKEYRGIPFEIRINEPNEATLASFKEYEDSKAKGKRMKEYSSFKDLLKDID